MSVGITLLGGPADGRDITLPDQSPPWSYRVAIPKSVTFLLTVDNSGWPPQQGYSVADYDLVLDPHALPSLTDGGVYQYRFRSMEPEPHYGQTLPTPSLEDLAGMRADPPPAAYPTPRDHLLACRTRYSLRRDADLNPQEGEVRRQVVVEAVRAALAEGNKREPDR